MCDDYNLCSKCFSSGYHNRLHSPNHPCICVPRPLNPQENRQLNVESRLNNLIHTRGYSSDVKCKMCLSDRLRGVHIKCDSCYKFDMCYECWSHNVHDPKHPMILFISDVVSEIAFNELKIGDKLGEGSFGQVYKAQLGNNPVALKLVSSEKIAASGVSLKHCIESIKNEMKIHKEIRSANLCKLFGFTCQEGPRQYKLGLILEFMELGTLENVIEREISGNMYLPLLRKAKMTAGIAHGLYDIHRKNFIHTDIKPDNILIDANFTAKISDLGIAKNRNSTASVGAMADFGNYSYLPNDFYLDNSYDKSVDVYSFGLVVYYFFTKSKHEWSHPRPCQARRVVIDRLEQIELLFMRIVIGASCENDPAFRETSERMKDMLESFCECADQLIRMSIPNYYSMSGRDKDQAIIRNNTKLIESTSLKQKLIRKYTSHGLVSMSDVRAPDVDKKITSFAYAGGVLTDILRRSRQN